MRFYEISPIAIVSREHHQLTYSSLVPLDIGQVVEISIRSKKTTGIVCQKVKKPSFETKPISRILDGIVLPKELLAIHDWLVQYYASHSANVWQTMLPSGILKSRRTLPKTEVIHHRKRTNIVLNKSQHRAMTAIEKRPGMTTLLHGITGSGKTEVYIHLIRKCLEDGKSAIILVPEIALTSQLVSELSGHFEDVVLTHSTMTEAARHRLWQGLLVADSPRVVVGPRSALFVPLSSIGLVIIDECHEPAYKQEKSPRYSALRTAGVLAKEHGARLVLGSATPLITDYYLASQRDPASIVTIDELAKTDAVLPSVTVVDLTNKSVYRNSQIFSDDLINALESQLNAGQQSLLFHNRRGSASVTLCENCGWNALCTRCHIPLTLHADMHTLLCHLCGLTERIPTSCPVCNHANIIHKGIGTKRIEEEVRRLFPQANIARFDGDSANGESVDARYSDLYNGSIDIIIGTQVVAKGLDLPHLRFVGVVQADSGLSLPDFYSSERVFQLLAQVSGRVGRNEFPSEVIIQTYQPEHPSIKFGIARDYMGFYAHVLSDRKLGHFPPFSFLLKAVCSYKTESGAINAARRLKTLIDSTHHSLVTVHGPMPAFYERTRDSYRWQIIIRSHSRTELLNVVRIIPNTHWQYELDPTSLL